MILILLSIVFKIGQRRIRDFSRVGGWYMYLGLAELMGHVLKLRIISLEYWQYHKNRIYNEVPFQSVCLYFCHNIHSLSISVYVLLLQMGSG